MAEPIIAVGHLIHGCSGVTDGVTRTMYAVITRDTEPHLVTVTLLEGEPESKGYWDGLLVAERTVDRCPNCGMTADYFLSQTRLSVLQSFGHPIWWPPNPPKK